MLDVYEIKQGSFEIVDSQMHQIREKRRMYIRLIRFVLVLLVFVLFTVVILVITMDTLLWLLVGIIPFGLGIAGYLNIRRLTTELDPKISSILLDYNKEKDLERFRIRRWQQGKTDEYTEEIVRFNQAIGYRVIWYDNGFLEVEIIVDPNFPGTKIFGTFDFFAIAELNCLFQIATPTIDKWYYELEDGTSWPADSIRDHQNEITGARVPWLIRNYFDEL